MLKSVIFLLVGFFLLVKGADWFVEGASSIARRLRIPSLIIGLTIVAFGTSAPELAVSITAAVKGSNDIAIGNVVGSNIFNLLVVIGMSALICPLSVKPSMIKKALSFVYCCHTSFKCADYVSIFYWKLLHDLRTS